VFACLSLLGSCADPLSIPGPAPSVTPAEALAIAHAYHTLSWKPTQRNVRHGRDPDGVMVHTPDESLARHGHNHGWWRPGQVMTGMPYQWGGFDTPRQFLDSLGRGEAAGDIATAEKRQLDDAGTSRLACGIDCSGLVSRCWRLERHYSTRELTSLCKPLDSLWQSAPGDILLKPGHVLLVHSWDPFRPAHLLVCEATLQPEWRVHLGSKPIAALESAAYRAWRYRHIRY